MNNTYRLTHPDGETINTYVYQTDIVRDCLEAVMEFAGEFEHASTREPATELPADFVKARKVQTWRALRAYLDLMIDVTARELTEGR